MGGIAAIVQAAQQQVDSQLASFQQAGEMKSKAKNLDFQAKISESNSNMADYEGQVNAADDYANNYRVMGRQAAAQAQGGILGSATGESLINESEKEAEKSQRRILLQSGLKRDSFLAESIGLRANAQALRRNARIATFEGILGPGARAVTDPMKINSAFRK